mmetsp:Transcript_84572/g.202704  ORF Transcript_84572/g.202704 Transcript_84572/m.202704 type:complete len:80 (+) Transcript_84572:697-936(+)
MVGGLGLKWVVTWFLLSTSTRLLCSHPEVDGGFHFAVPSITPFASFQGLTGPYRSSSVTSAPEAAINLKEPEGPIKLTS